MTLASLWYPATPDDDITGTGPGWRRLPGKSNPRLSSIISPSVVSRHSPPIPQRLQIRRDRRIQPRPLRLLLPERRHEALHLLVERLVVVLPDLCTDVAPRDQDVAVLPDLLDRRALAEAGDVGVLASFLLSAPGVIGPGDAVDLLVGQ